MSAAGTVTGAGVEGGGVVGGSSRFPNTPDFKRQSKPSMDDDTQNQRPGITTPFLSDSEEGAVGRTTSDGDEEGDAERARVRKLKHQQHRQTRLTKALLSYISFFRIVQPLVSLSAFGTITPVLSFFHSQTIFPTIQATLYVFTATLAGCSLFFSIIYLLDVFLHKPLFWPFTSHHFRQTSTARIGGDLIVCMVFCGLWFLSLVGLVIDTIWVDCGKLTGLEPLFLENRRSIKTINTICHLEKATLGLAAVSWACWMGVLLVLLYGHFWKRRRVIAARLRGRLSQQPPSTDAGAGQTGGPAIAGRSTLAVGGAQHQQQPSDDCGWQDREGEVGLTGVIHQYDDNQSSRNPTLRR